MENVYRSNFLEGKAAKKPILNELMIFFTCKRKEKNESKLVTSHSIKYGK